MPNDQRASDIPWTILKTLQWTADYFSRNDIESPRIDAELLLAHVLGCERIHLYMRHDQPLNDDELARFKKLIKRRARHEPIAYIVGCKEFWSLRFDVNPAVLIPRPDTERLVESALAHLTGGDFGNGADVLELGTGSGAVIVALAHTYGAGRFWATDRSWPAVCVARRNAGRHGVAHAIRFLIADWLQAITPERPLFDLIVTNPPYIPTPDIESLAPDVGLFEPAAALDGGADGLREISAILASAHAHLRPGGLLLMEVGYDQRAAVMRCAEQTAAYERVEFVKDYAGHHRVAVLRPKNCCR